MKSLYFLLSVLIVSCEGESQLLKEIAEPGLKEVSGIEYVPQTGMLWALEDSGNKNSIYGFSAEGAKKAEIEIAGVKNNDWEDLASDNEGNIYIGDFGNNENDRDDLAIYKIDRAGLKEDNTTAAAKISFYYPEQKDFPPKKSEKFFDVEAFVEHNGSFYLFTKNRSAKFDGSFYVYKVPNAKGSHPAKLIAILKSCSVYNKCVVTGADVSPDGKTIALISADKIWFITGFEEGNFTQQNMQMFPLGHFSQKEGICFKDSNTLLIADEKNKKSGGMFYEVSIAGLKTKR